MRCFLGIKIQDKIIKNIQEVGRNLEKLPIEAKYVENSNLHVTIKFFENLELSKLDDVKLFVKQNITNSFDMKFIGVGAYPNVNKPRVVWIGIQSTVLEEICKNFGGSSPHLTIARIKKGGDLSEFVKEFNMNFGSMKVDHISLFKSSLSSTGPIYTEIWGYDLD